MGRHWIILVLLGSVLTVTWVQAEGLLPALPKAKAKADEQTLCVEPLPEMRRRHMDMMIHQRDDTLRRGIRTKQHSLAQCINCHVSKRDDGTYPTHKDRDHFCNTCHEFAAVSIDCFECHRDKPDPDARIGRWGHGKALAVTGTKP